MTSMKMPTVPESVRFADVKAALASLGVAEIGSAMSFTFKPGWIEVVHQSLDTDGAILTSNDEVATVTVAVPVKDE
jgi:hypothetical protein